MTRKRAISLLLLIMALAALLRLYRLDDQSLWWDEYTSHVFLEGHTLTGFLTINRSLDPLTLPVYYTLEYLWNRVAGGSVYALRLLSVLLGVAAIPLLYALGKAMFGVGPGLVAALLLALSPTHIHHSQGIRMYVVFVFLAALMTWSFVSLLDRPQRRFWWIHGGASLLLYWTHPMAGLLSAALGGYLLLSLRQRRRFFIVWTTVQAVLYAPTVWYLSRVRFWPVDTTEAWIKAPWLRTLIADVFFDDIAGFQWQFRLNALADSLGVGRLILDVATAVFILGLLGMFTWRRVCDTDNIRTRGLVMLMWLWLIVPPLMLFVVSWVWRPCMFPRYTLHSSLALYLLLGGAACLPKTKAGQSAVVATLVLTMLMQQAWLVGPPQRTDWKSTAEYLHDHLREGDVVVVDDLLWRDVFVHNARHLTKGPLDAPVAAAGNATLLAMQTVRCHQLLAAYPHEAEKEEAVVWAVLAMDHFVAGPPLDYEFALDYWKIPYERHPFPSTREIYVYRTVPSMESGLPNSIMGLKTRWARMVNPDASEVVALDHETVRAFGDLAERLADHGFRQAAMAVLNELTAHDGAAARIYSGLLRRLNNDEDPSHALWAIHHLWRGYGFRENRQPRLALEAFSTALSYDRRDGGQNALFGLELGIEATDAGLYEYAHSVLCDVARTHGADAALKNLLDPRIETKDIASITRAAVSCHRGVLALDRGEVDAAARLLREAVEHDPGLAMAWSTLGYALMLQGDLERARDALLSAAAMEPPPDAYTYGNLALLHMAFNEPDAARNYSRIAREADPGFEATFGQLCLLLFEQQAYEAALDELRRLIAGGVPFPSFVERYLSEKTGSGHGQDRPGPEIWEDRESRGNR